MLLSSSGITSTRIKLRMLRKRRKILQLRIQNLNQSEVQQLRGYVFLKIRVKGKYFTFLRVLFQYFMCFPCPYFFIFLTTLGNSCLFFILQNSATFKHIVVTSRYFLMVLICDKRIVWRKNKCKSGQSALFQGEILGNVHVTYILHFPLTKGCSAALTSSR